LTVAADAVFAVVASSVTTSVSFTCTETVVAAEAEAFVLTLRFFFLFSLLETMSGIVVGLRLRSFALLDDMV
jgi:hypothetical protein